MKANHPSDVIQAPLLTEETTIQMNAHNKYVFRVDPRANKREIKDAIETHFNVTVVSVNTMNYTGKMGAKRARGGTGRKAAWKKAIVSLKESDSIDLI